MLAAAAALVSCELDFYRSDTMTSSMLKENPGAAVYTTDGNYSMFKDRIDYSNSRSGNEYPRLVLLMSELRGDNVALSGRTTDPLYQNMTYTDDPTLADLSYFWYNSYKIIYGANSNIESMVKGESVATDHLIGENYFMRAFCHLQLLNLYATPYTRGADKPGVVLRTSTDCSVTTRATVGEVYEQIVADLLEAANLMQGGVRRGDAGFIGYETARGLLTRVYLYMGKWDECITLAEDMLGSNPAANLDDITNYYPNTRTSKETLWCIAKLATDPDYSPKSQVASMYYSPDSIGGTGWCEMYWSDPLMQLIFRHPEDKRLSQWGTIGATNDGKKMIHWPVIDTENRFRLNANVNNVTFDMDAAQNTITYQGKNYVVKRTTERTGYPEYYIENLYAGVADDNDGFLGPKQTKVYVRDNVNVATGIRQTFPAYTMSKFSYQNGNPMLASPAVIRMAEIVLNRAEAYCKLGQEQKALDDVNVIRKRAGLSGDALWTLDNYKAEGYESVLDVVLDERRLELCFEGHRAFDLYRNGKSIDRRFAGNQDWEVLDLEALDFKFPYCIPFEEVSVSGIPGNGKNY